MRNVRKAARMSAAAFLNAIRLHKDSILLFMNQRYPSAFQISILSQEEIGKTFLLEEFVYRVQVGEHDPANSGPLLTDIVSHKWKQLWFARQEVDFGGPPFSRRAIQLVDEARSGVLERRKQDGTYVGLTRTPEGRLDPDGRMVVPAFRVGEKQAAGQITRVADVLTSLADGFLQGILMMDTEELSACLTPELAAELAELWPAPSA
jgi:AbiV family abortive infection protein